MRHPYLNDQPVKTVLGVVFAANRGMCGSFHSLLEKKVKQIVNQPASLLHYPYDEVNRQDRHSKPNINFEWIVIGKKGEQLVRRLEQPIIASFTRVSDSIEMSELDALFKTIKDAYDSGKYQKVVIFYTQYISTMKQVPMMRQILPISQQEVKRLSDDWQLNLNTFEARDTNKTNYMIEPSRRVLINVIVLLLLKMTLYHALVQTKASVESARMMAMKNATDAAEEMQGVLNLVFNQLRQSKITSEIAEISAGRAALE